VNPAVLGAGFAVAAAVGHQQYGLIAGDWRHRYVHVRGLTEQAIRATKRDPVDAHIMTVNAPVSWRTLGERHECLAIHGSRA
jgi:hypothetical protein